jgi:predicted lipoprotein with Yx(FWY)xxD motif
VVAAAAIAFTANSAISGPARVPAEDVTATDTAPGGTATETAGPTLTGTATATETATASPTMTTKSPSGTHTASPGVPGAPVKNCAGKNVTPPTQLKSATVSGHNNVLVDQSGCTVYIFTKDTPTNTTINGTMLQTWKPVPGPATAASNSGVQQNKLSTFRTPSGATQATYNGHQLYYDVNDKAPGAANGQGVNGTFFIIGTSGSPIQ